MISCQRSLLIVFLFLTGCSMHAYRGERKPIEQLATVTSAAVNYIGGLPFRWGNQTIFVVEVDDIDTSNMAGGHPTVYVEPGYHTFTAFVGDPGLSTKQAVFSFECKKGHTYLTHGYRPWSGPVRVWVTDSETGDLIGEWGADSETVSSILEDF